LMGGEIVAGVDGERESERWWMGSSRTVLAFFFVCFDTFPVGLLGEQFDVEIMIVRAGYVSNLEIGFEA
jgi:hypothetical protein